MNPKRPVRCAIYTRKSTEEGLEQDFNSLDAQREAGEAYVASQKAEGWIALPDRFDDGGYSGGTLDRPALKRLLSAIEQSAIDVIIVYKIDRLSRSLMDFARLVEVFDRRSVTFVSVTQSFNTTNSMGRLTLNVLLSFAQFEREVTGERIRDKFAASKKKGIWMGGNPPLGYDVDSRKLVVNAAEAESVRLIFQRYLELGCARLLCTDLAARAIVSKRRRIRDHTIGGKPFGRSALYLILANRTYLGKTTHKGHAYPGEHKPIVPADLFEAVQKRLAEQAPNLSGKARLVQDAPYFGILFDDTGTPMLPAYTVKKGLRYRYYVSRPATKGERSNASIPRIPAPALETYLSEVFARLDVERIIRAPHVEAPNSFGSPIGYNNEVAVVCTTPALQRIEILADSIVITLDRATVLARWRARTAGSQPISDSEVLDRQRASLSEGETLTDDGDILTLRLAVRARFRGGRADVVRPSGTTERSRIQDLALVKAVARAHRWKQMLLHGEAPSIEAIAQRFGLDRGHVGLTLNLAFLSPKITRTILRGHQPGGLRLKELLHADIPLSWALQDEFIQRLANAGA